MNEANLKVVGKIRTGMSLELSALSITQTYHFYLGLLVQHGCYLHSIQIGI